MKIPSHVAEGKSPPFPEGTFRGKLVEAKQDWYPSDAKNAPDKKDSARLTLTFKEITAIEGPQVGARPLMQRLDIVRPPKPGQPPVSIVDVTEWDDSVPFGIRQSATLFSQLGLALGAATLDATGNVDVDLDEFITALAGGVFTNREVLFTVEQRSYDSKTQKNPDGSAKKQTVANIIAFKGVDGDEVAPSPADVAEAAGPSLRTR